MSRCVPMEKIKKRFDKLSAPKKVEVLFEALDFMQQYNGRSKSDCIALAMGYEHYAAGMWGKEKNDGK